MAPVLSGTATAAPGAPPVLGDNVVTNPGFETDTAGWSVTNLPGATLTRVAGGHSGGYSARVDAPTSGTPILNDTPANFLTSTEAGTGYMASAWVRGQAGTEVRIRLREMSAAGQMNLAQTAVTLADANWTQVSVGYTALAAGNSLDLNVYVQSMLANQSVNVDDVALQPECDGKTMLAGCTVVPQYGSDAVTNPGFETDTAGWSVTNTASATGATLSRVAGGHSGGYSGKVLAPTGGTPVLNDTPTNFVTSSRQGTTYVASAWVRGQAGADVRIRLREVSASGQVGFQQTAVKLADANWSRISVSYPALGTGNSLDLNVYGQTLLGGQAVNADDVSLVPVCAGVTTLPGCAAMPKPGPAPSPTPIVQTITFNKPADTTFGAGPVTLTATGGASGNPVTFATNSSTGCTVSGNSATLVGAGTCSITASQAGNATYAAATPDTETFIVSQAPQAITFADPADTTFGAGPVSLTATGGMSGNPATFATNFPAVCTVSGNSATPVGAGTCSITASQAGDVNYGAATPVTQTFTVAQALQTITFTKPADTTFGAGPVTLAATGGASGNPVTFAGNSPAVCTVTGNSVTLGAAGTCSVTASQAGNANYASAAPATLTFAISQRSQTISFTDPADTSFGAGPATLTATGGASGNPVTFAGNSPAVCTVTGNSATLVAAGTCSVTASQAGNANYASAAPVTQTFTVAQRSQTISFTDPADTSFGAGPATLTATGGASGNPVTFAGNSPAVCTVTGNSATLVAAGTCSVTASQAGNANYASASPVTQTFVVAQAAQTGLDGMLVPRTPGTLWGHYRSGNAMSSLFNLETTFGRQFDVVKQYRDFGTAAWPNADERDAAAKGRILHITLGSFVWNTPDPTLPAPGATAEHKVYTYQQIISGSCDAFLRKVADGLKTLPGKHFFDFVHEPELVGDADRLAMGNATDYAAAYRHVHDVFNARGVNNLVWVLTFAGSQASNQSNWDSVYKARYPGDNYVDWIGWDPYNSNTSNWRSPLTVMSTFYNALDAGMLGTGAKSKPRMLSEYGCTQDSRRPAWILQVPDALRQLPKIRSVEWFNSGTWGALDDAASQTAYAQTGHDAWVNVPH